MQTIGVLNGPNLDRLGKREPSIYGHQTINDLELLLFKEGQALGVGLEFFQSNHEGALIDTLAEWMDNNISGFIINAGAFTHTSIALRDAVAASGVPTVEVHISNVYKREVFRHHSFLSDISVGVIAGLGFQGYLAALQFLAGYVNR